MTFGLKPYPVYKDSGVEWLGQVPSHWDIVPGKSCLTERKLSNVGLVETRVLSLSYGRIVERPIEKLHGLVPASFETYQIVDTNNIIVRPTDLQNDKNSLRFGLSRLRGIITSAYMCLQASEELHPNYVYFLLHAYDLNKVFYGLGSGLRQNLDWRDFKYLPCLRPPILEQSAIVRYLNHIDARIRRTLVNKQKKIKLLQEFRQTLINLIVSGREKYAQELSSSVIRGSDSEPPIKLKLVPLKRLVGFQEGPGIMAADFRDEGTPLLRISCLRGEVASLTGCNYLDPDMVNKRWSHFAVQPGDYLLSASANTGAVVKAGDDTVGAIPYTGIIRLWPRNEEVFMPFMQLYMSSSSFQGQVEVARAGVGIKHFGPTHLNRMYVALPPLEEQKQIVDWYQKSTKGLTLLELKEQRELATIREYRNRLFSDVITGKLDVRNVAEQVKEHDELSLGNCDIQDDESWEEDIQEAPLEEVEPHDN